VRPICSISLLLILVATADADDNAKPEMSPKDRLTAIQAEYEAATAGYSKAAEVLPDTPEGNKKKADLWQAYDTRQASRFLAAVELAKAYPTSEVSFDALEWVLSIPRSYYVPFGKPAGKAAMELLTENHAANPKIGKIIAAVGGVNMPTETDESHQAANALIQAVLRKNPDRTARGQAMMALAGQAMRRFAVAEYKKAANVDALATDAEKACQAVVNGYADCPLLTGGGQRSLGDVAKDELYDLRNLRVGNVAPDLQGEDLEGIKFKLQDYRGKVTVVVFWAKWCFPCMAMVPHERKLVARLNGRDFVLIGVNGDGDRDKAKQVTAKEKMTWRSFWNGPKLGDGPLSRAWNVRNWPTIYVLDELGTIRYKGVTGEDLDKAIDELLAELEKKKRG
jgi:thiol-disulfide isomerase/thioredoxin